MDKFNILKMGDKIRLLREQQNETQDDLATLLNVKRQQVSYYENGNRKPSYEQLITIAQHYNTTIDYLLGLTEMSGQLVDNKDKELRIACDYLSLSDSAIKELRRIINLSQAITEKDFNFIEYFINSGFFYKYILEFVKITDLDVEKLSKLLFINNENSFDVPPNRVFRLTYDLLDYKISKLNSRFIDEYYSIIAEDADTEIENTVMTNIIDVYKSTIGDDND